MHTLRILATFVFLSQWSSFASAGLIRYDVTIGAPASDYSDAHGYMVFQNPVYDGNIMPYIVDWKFHEPLFGWTLGSANSKVDISREFIVDDIGTFVSDNQLCFGIEEACDGAFARGFLFISGSSGSSWFGYPGGVPIIGYRDAIFSEPIMVPLSSSLYMISIGLLSFILIRRLTKSSGSHTLG